MEFEFGTYQYVWLSFADLSYKDGLALMLNTNSIIMQLLYVKLFLLSLHLLYRVLFQIRNIESCSSNRTESISLIFRAVEGCQNDDTAGQRIAEHFRACIVL